MALNLKHLCTIDKEIIPVNWNTVGFLKRNVLSVSHSMKSAKFYKFTE